MYSCHDDLKTIALNLNGQWNNRECTQINAFLPWQTESVAEEFTIIASLQQRFVYIILILCIYVGYK